MLYFLLDGSQIKLLFVKKTLLNQFESAFYQKLFQTPLLAEGKCSNPDLIASAIKEALTHLPQTVGHEKEFTLILPQESFKLMRTDMPVDIAPSILNSYLKEKARTQLTINVDDYYFDYIISENGNKKQILFYAIERNLVDTFKQPFQLLEKQITAIVPESLAYYKLFEKTLRKDKKENIFYVSYEANRLSGYIYDSYGLIQNEKWVHELKNGEKIQDILKQKTADYEAQGNKLNRLVLSGKDSETVRQDTFTKQVGVWTNPLKRIIPNFYQEYVKMLSGQNEQVLPVLEYDGPIGAFILNVENKTFSLLNKSNNVVNVTGDVMTASKKIPLKPILIFLATFIVVGISLFFIFTKVRWGQITPSFALFPPKSPSPTLAPTLPPPTATPAVSVKRSEIKIKVLNGSGVRGKATEVKDQLKTLGYEEILTDNADNFDYLVTEIQVKKGQSALANLIKTDIADNVSTPKITELKADEVADAVIIIGQDYK